MKKLAIIITHPIQYYSPLFQLIAKRNKLKIKIFYTWEQAQQKFFDEKFGKEIKWDIPLLDGYDYTFVKNTAKKPGSTNFSGVKNPTLITDIENWKANAILIFGWNHHSHLKAMKYFKNKIPIYFRGDSNLIDNKPWFKKKLRKIWLTHVYRLVDYAFYVGQNNKKYFLEYGLSENQLIFAPHSVDNKRFTDNDTEYHKKAKLWKQKLNYTEKDLIFLFVGKFETKKNPMILLNAAKQLPEFKFLFIGNGKLENLMKQNKSENTSFLPFQNQSLMPIIYRIGDVLVLPSQGPNETWGLAVNEAMACGKAILTSNKVGCATDLVKQNENGYIFESGNINDLSKKLKLFKNKITNFGKKSKQIIKNWNFEKIAEALEKNIP